MEYLGNDYLSKVKEKRGRAILGGPRGSGTIDVGLTFMARLNLFKWMSRDIGRGLLCWQPTSHITLKVGNIFYQTIQARRMDQSMVPIQPGRRRARSVDLALCRRPDQVFKLRGLGEPTRTSNESRLVSQSSKRVRSHPHGVRGLAGVRKNRTNLPGARITGFALWRPYSVWRKQESVARINQGRRLQSKRV